VQPEPSEIETVPPRAHQIQELTQAIAKKHGIRVYRIANVGNHLQQLSQAAL
jgi:hypothetical protein